MAQAVSALVVPRGKPKSGRVWREPGSRSKAIICSVPKSSWKRKQIERSENRAMKELEREMREAAKREREEKKEKMKERRLRKIEKQKKGEIVQKITNASKLKRLKKKQIRALEKR